ncbi:MAG: hypothetical protein H7833_14300 [Magnetococcus sp. DMHC-1]
MGVKVISYDKARPDMLPGDVIAFSGSGSFSELIKFSTLSSVSHVAVIMQTKLMVDGDPQSGMFNQIIEAVTTQGVVIKRLSDKLKDYDGEIWWLPLRRSLQKSMDKKKFFDFLIHQEGKKYDMPQAVKSALDASDNIPLIGKLTHNQEDFSAFFCSELVAGALETAGAIKHLNASEVTPIDLCRFAIFNDDYYQIKGKLKSIKGYNTTDPVGWGE